MRSSIDGTPADAGDALAINPLAAGRLGFADSTGPVANFENGEIVFENSTITLNDLRRSMALQKWLEVNARGGYRYNEQIYGHFQEIVSDYRIQRAEYLGGGKVPVVIDEVRATANSTFDTEEQPIGDLAGYGLAVGDANSFRYRATEHGLIMSIISVMPKPSYYGQGLDRVWTRQDRFDYPWPEFAHIGEQEVLNKEVFFGPQAANDEDNNLPFGYLPRYSEMKYVYDRIAGDFKTSLGFWHLARKFVSAPALDSFFLGMYEHQPLVEETFRRAFYVQDGTDYLWMSIYHQLGVSRKLPYFGVPGGI